jgi:hypothetical protein
MCDIAEALGMKEDAAFFGEMAKKVRESFGRTFFDSATGLYVDGEGARHSSLHANAAALAFGLVPADRVAAIVGFIERKGMACSVYFSQYVLEALCLADRADVEAEGHSPASGRGGNR